MPRRHTWVLLIVVAGFGVHKVEALAAEPPVYEAYAVRYARLLGYPVASLVQGPIQNENSTSR